MITMVTLGSCQQTKLLQNRGVVCSQLLIAFLLQSFSIGCRPGRTMHCLMLSLRGEGSWSRAQKHFLQQFSTKNFYCLSLNVNVLFLCIFSAGKFRVVSMSMSTIVSWVQHPSQAYNGRLILWTSKTNKDQIFFFSNCIVCCWTR